MKFKDYYETLGVARDASADDIKKAYRKLAHKHHPDVSKAAGAEDRFKEVGEAYATLKDPEKRAAYDQLGRHRPGEDFVPPRGWQQDAGPGFGSGASFDDVDLSDLFAAFSGRGSGRARSSAWPGEDFEVTAPVTIEQIHASAEIDLDLMIPETGDDGLPRRTARTFRVKIPQGAEDGQRMRLTGRGGPGANGGKPGDLYVVLALQPHPVYRVVGRDLYLDLPLAPYEAVLGANVEVPTPGGPVELAIAPGTIAGRKLRLAGRGLPKAKGGAGDLYAMVRIETPSAPTPRERELYAELQKASSFDAGKRFGRGATT